MTEDQRDLLLAARESHAAAGLLLSGGYPGFAVSRAYYCMFYVAEAFLEGAEMSFSKHSAVIAAFGREFVQTGKVPVEFHRSLLEALELRHQGDYGPRKAVPPEQAQQLIAQAKRFLEVAEELIGPLPVEES